MISIGLDEVGRGSLAGPLLVCAVRLANHIDGIKDSKKISPKKRSKIAKEILACNDVGFGWVSNDEIDDFGLSNSLYIASARAMTDLGLTNQIETIIIDGNINYLPLLPNVKVVIKADDKYASVGAASIVAKHTRDLRMAELARYYQGYDLANNYGYGTNSHIDAINKKGYSPIHRRTFKIKSSTTTTKEIGDETEEIATNYLIKAGHIILDRNWRNRFCEIDIISKKNTTIYFTEVKFRRNNYFGDGIDAITSRKMKQIQFAAEFWLHANKISNQSAELQVISLEGSPPAVKDVLTIG